MMQRRALVQRSRPNPACLIAVLRLCDSRSQVGRPRRGGGLICGGGGSRCWRQRQTDTDAQAGRSRTMATLPELIQTKREGRPLSADQMHRFVSAAAAGRCDSAQTGAMLMAMFLKGLDDEETECLTGEIIKSGKQLSWGGVCVDKHSTGGVGDKVSIPLAPALAAVGLTVPMVSGRGLGFTGGTLDKLESIPGYRTGLTEEEMAQVLSAAGCFIAATTDDICPADRILYATRDITATVDNVSLITGSVLSKKIAEGAKYLVIDLKVGHGAFMKNIESGEILAQKMISVSKKFGVKTRVCLTRMDEPIGETVGNSLEIEESCDCLRGKGSADLEELVCKLGGELAVMAGKAATSEDGTELIRSTLHNGKALEYFKRMLRAHGVESNVVEALSAGDYSVLPQAKHRTPFLAPHDGWVESIDGLEVARACNRMGAGRERAGEKIKFAVGVRLMVTSGQQIKKGDMLLVAFHDAPLPMDVHDDLYAAIHLSTSPCSSTPSRFIRTIS